MKILARLARPMGTTCHRAFDMTADPFAAMETLIGLGIDRILTSGQQPTAPQGAQLIKQLIGRAAGRIVIMPGSGVKEHNFEQLVRETGATEIHIHLDKQVATRMVFRQSSVYMGKPDQSEFEYTVTDAERVRKVTSD
jgi:copper homeostasis protein